MRAVPDAEPARRVFAPTDVSMEARATARAEGWVVVDALEPGTDPSAEAVRLGCGHVLTATGPVPVQQPENDRSGLDQSRGRER